MTRRRRLATLAVVLGMAAAACGGSPERQATELRKTAGSWAATLRTAADEWARGAVPPSFVASTATLARSDLAGRADRLRPTLGASATAPADAVLAALPALLGAVERGDRGAAIATARTLAQRVPADPTPPLARQR